MLGTETVTFHLGVGEDDDGHPNPAGSWTVDNCNVQTGSGTEDLATDRTAAAQQVTVYLPQGAPAVDNRVTLTIRGKSGWRIVGDPIEMVSDEPDPDLSGWVLTVTRGEA